MATKAIVLAAGFGSRLRPLTCAIPKPLLPIWGEPMLARIVAALRERGVTEIAVNCHYLHEQVERWCAANGCRASYEPEILGTGGVLNPLRDWIGQDEFYVVNGDIVIENAPPLAIPADALGACLVAHEGPRTLEVEPQSGFVTNWKSDEAGWGDTCTYCGFALLRPEILDYVPPQGFSTLIAAYEKAMMNGRFMKAVTADDLLWTDAGTIPSYIDLNRTADDNAFDALPQIAHALDALRLRWGEGATSVEFLGARGSDRVFFRLGAGTPRRDAIAVLHDDEKRGENARYATHAAWLREKGIPVPEVYADLADERLTVFEWGGSDRKMSLEEYVKVVEMLATFNSLVAAPDLPALEPPFDAALWAWERELFAKHCLGGRFGLAIAPEVEAELTRVAEALEKEPAALVHRDFQSTNILWKNGRMTLIDFQGMRRGPGAYDLASLLYDPYVTFSEGERRALVALYAKKVGRPEIVDVFPLAAVQRLIQCLGAYGRLASVGQPQFAQYVLPALENLLDAADRAELDAVGALAEDLIARETKRKDACTCGHHHHDHADGACTCGHHHHDHT